MDKKQYTTPEITLLGDVEEMTKGSREHGNRDQYGSGHRTGGGSGGGGGSDPTSGN